MVRSSVRVASITAAALLLLGAGAAQAFNPQPDPPGFGMFGITDFQRAHLHVSLPVLITNGNGGKKGSPACTIDVSFVNEDGKAVFMETHTIAPGTTGRAVFDPRPGRDVVSEAVGEVAPTRHQLRAVIMPVGGRQGWDACTGLVATVQVDNGAGAPTLTLSPVLSPRDASSGQATGKRKHAAIHLTGALAIGFGHTARLNAVNVGTGDGIQCTINWAFVDEAGVRTEGPTATIGGGQAAHADFAHTDANRGVAAIRGEVTVTEPDSGSCPSDSTIGTFEGFDSALGHSHSIVPAQLAVPATQ
jgi:hypothetical protein